MRITALFLGIISVLGSMAGAAELTRYEKLESVLSHYGVLDTTDYGKALSELSGTQTRASFETILKAVDPAGVLKPYLGWDANAVTVYADRDARTVVDYRIAFRTDGGAESDPHSMATAFGAARLNDQAHPLAHLRVALDPGHMGGAFWDAKTGKFVEMPAGRVSEGVIAFQVCMLLKAELERVGAEVMITRTGLTPVTTEKLESYDLHPWALREIRNNADSPWFTRLLDAAATEQRLVALFDASPEFRKLSSENERDNYFISRLDLATRADRINAFRPDLTLVVHFDAADLHKLQSREQAVRGYVMGNVMAGEASSREQRFDSVRTLIDGTRWNMSVGFTHAVVQALSKATGVAVQTSPVDYMAVRVADGVYGRNLALSRLVSEGVMAYIEVLHYDFENDFHRLLPRDRHAEVDGVKLDYPARLDDVVAGLKRGVLDYVGSFDRSSLP